MRRLLSAVLITLGLPHPASGAGLEVEWLPEMPIPHGRAAAFVGLAEGGLVFAGGTNFPDGPPWEGGKRAWHDEILILEQPNGEWRSIGRLPRPIGHGTQVTTGRGVLCIGGADGERHHADVFLLRRRGQLVTREQLATFEPMPNLPRPLAFSAAAILDGKVYVVGGTDRPDATAASAEVLVLDLADPGKGWWPIEPLPAPGRILPVVAVRDGRLFVFSGASLAPDAEGKPARTYLSDAWSYQPDRGWRRLADMPRPAVAAPSPAPAVGKGHLLVLGGDDGSKVGFEPRSAHPGFPAGIQQYDTVTNTWASVASLPQGVVPPVVTTAVEWKGAWVIPGGERRPAARTTQVIALRAVGDRSTLATLDWAVIATYLAGMILVGWLFMRREAASSTEAYFRGGQRIPVWVAGLSLFATMLSSLTFMGIPAKAYHSDITWFVGQLALLAVVPFVAAHYLPFFRSLNLTSAYEYLERRFNLDCRLFAAGSFLLLHLGRIAIVLYLPALALASVSDIDITTSIAVLGALCILYTVMGGIQAVVWTDAIQALVLMGGALLCLGIALGQVEGGAAGALAIARADDKLMGNLDWSGLDLTAATTSVWVLVIALGFNSLISYTSSQDVVQRYVTTRDLAAARRSMSINLWMSVGGGLTFFLLGTAIYAFHKTHPGAMDPAMARPDAILPAFILQQLPTGIAGLVIAAIFAASQSTISSSLNSMATCYVKDIDERLLRPGRPDADYLRAAMAVVIVAGIASVGTALVMAWSGISSAFETFNTLIGLAAGPMGGLFALGIFTRSANGRGAFAGALVAFATVLALRLLGTPIAGILYGFIGFSTCMAIGWMASHLTGDGEGDGSLSIPGGKTRG
jgi:solute:Na+ symporter, SSS family